MSVRSGMSDLAEGVCGSYVEGHSACRFLVWVWCPDACMDKVHGQMEMAMGRKRFVNKGSFVGTAS